LIQINADEKPTKEKIRVNPCLLKRKMKAEEKIYSKIIDAIQDIGGIGATIDEISKAVPFGRHTLSKYMDHLRADGRVSYKQIGRAKVWFVSKSPLQHIFLLSEEEKTYTEKIFSRILAYMPEGIMILDFDYNILFMNRYLTALYGDCIGQKYYHVFFGTAHQDHSQIAEIIDGRSKEVESHEEDKDGRILDIKARRVENPDGSFSVIAIICDVTEKVRYEKRIKNLSELHRLLGESVNRSYTINQLCSTILKNLRDVISFDMGDILIYDPIKDMLFGYAQIGYPRGNEISEAEEWKRRIAMEAIHRKEVIFFDFSASGMVENELAKTASHLAEEYNLQEVYAIPLKTKGELHGALLILTSSGRTISKEDRSLLEGVSEVIAGGIAKIKAEEEWKLKANAIRISTQPIFMTNLEGKQTYVNPAFLELWGYDREKEVLGRPCSEFWKDEAEDVLTTVREKGTWEGDLIALRKDGSEFNARLSASLIIGKKGPFQLVAAVEPES
jgi:PAS domain S-box-containing protein